MKSVIFSVVAFVVSAAPVLALDGPGRALVASNTRLQIDTKPVVTSGVGGGVSRSFIPPYSGELRVKWEVKSGDGTEVFANANVSHLSNCSRTSTKTTFVLQSCVLRVIGGMPVTINASAGVENTVSLRNVGLYYDVVNSDGKAIRYEVIQIL